MSGTPRIMRIFPAAGNDSALCLASPLAKTGRMALCLLREDILPSRLATEFLQTGDYVLRIIGHRRCARLLSLLRRAQQDGEFEHRVQVGTPQALDVKHSETSYERINRLLATATTRLDGLVSSAGGWHDLCDADLCSYGICALSQTNADEVLLSTLPSRDSLLADHPAWPAFSFIPDVDRAAACEVISHVLDPRWFARLPARDIDDNGVSYSKLRAYMGLLPTIVNEIDLHAEPTPSSVAQARATQLMRSWHALGYLTGEIPLEKTRHFLYSAMRYFTRSQTKSLLSASRRMLSFVADVWLDSTYAYDDLFVPEYFFEFASEAVAYREHAGLLRSTPEVVCGS